MVLRRALLAWFLLLSCSYAFAQLENGTIVGSVRNPEGHAVPGVTVTTSSDSLVDRSITRLTDSDGRYRFPAIPPGVYDVKAALPGFVTVIRKEIRVFVGTTITVDFEMGMEKLTETMEISGEPPLIDATSSAVQHTVPTETVERLPKFASVLDLIKLTPGVGTLDLVAYGDQT